MISLGYAFYLRVTYADGFTETIDSDTACRLGYSTSGKKYKGYYKELK